METLTCPQATQHVRVRTIHGKRPTASILLQPMLRWYRLSVLRLGLLQLLSCYHRIGPLQRISGTLRFDEVRRSLPQVSCSDSRNEMQFCTASIQSLKEAYPYLTLADVQLFCQGFFLAEKWYAHMGTKCRKSEQSSSSTSVEDEMLDPPE